MDNASGETGVASQERLAEDARVIASLVDAVDDFECLGAEAAAEFGL